MAYEYNMFPSEDPEVCESCGDWSKSLSMNYLCLWCEEQHQIKEEEVRYAA